MTLEEKDVLLLSALAAHRRLERWLKVLVIFNVVLALITVIIVLGRP